MGGGGGILMRTVKIGYTLQATGVAKEDYLLLVGGGGGDEALSHPPTNNR